MSSQKESTPKGKTNEELLTPKKLDLKSLSSTKNKIKSADEGSSDYESEKKVYDSSPRKVENFIPENKERSLRHDHYPTNFNYLRNKRGHDDERSFMNRGSRSSFNSTREFNSRDRSRNYSSRSKGGDYRNVKQDEDFRDYNSSSRRGDFQYSSIQNKPYSSKSKGWICRDIACDGTNFLSRDTCFKCGRRIPHNPLFRELPQKVTDIIFNHQPKSEFKIPYNPVTGPNFKIIPKSEAIESPYTHSEISKAIALISKIKDGKGEKELLEIIRKFN